MDSSKDRHEPISSEPEKINPVNSDSVQNDSKNGDSMNKNPEDIGSKNSGAFYPDPAWGDPIPQKKIGYKERISEFWGDNRIYTIWMAVVLVICFAVGYFISGSNPELSDELMKTIEQAMSGMNMDDSFQLFLQIFFNNARIALFAIAFGIVLGLFPLFIAIANGLMIGIVSEYIVRTQGLSYLLVGILPHGILELPAIVLAAGVGVRLGAVVFSKLVGRKVTWASFFKELSKAGYGYFYLIVPMLLVAAAIEVYVTGTLLDVLFVP
ncbi:stage II sporulation protein M [Methanolapillus ohkumae]|uniref:Stage II sporulation protein M n=1 Tax=Methanolapillus ohkumae TaxID=3028298 RepID=A0AA96ZVV3_9EURY|nr:hypothetical protein MsAm2_10970 [Methanosarcinaceae archaeon Am2]